MIFGSKSLVLAFLANTAVTTQALIDLYGDPVNNNPASDYPLHMCQGDCDVDAHCSCDMVCYQFSSVSATLPPGCSGSIYNHPTAGVYDYCACPAGGCAPDGCSGGETLLPPSGSGNGDPHFLSWSGEWFDYMGECDLKLVHVPSIDGKNGLDIDARTTIRYSYSFIESAAIKIGEDVLEVSSWGEHALNGVEGALALASEEATALRGKTGDLTVGGYPVYYNKESKRRSSFDIVLMNGSNITLYTNKDLVGVKVTASYREMFDKVTGLWGTYDGKMMGRDGETDLGADINARADEWQVRDNEPSLFRTAREPQYPNKCVLPALDEKEARRLSEGVTEEEARVACDHLKENEHEFLNCIYDVTATNDLQLADAGAM